MRHPGRLLLMVLLPWLLLAAACTGAASGSVREGLPPPPPPPTATDPAAEVARLRSLLASAEAEAQAERARADAADRAARVAAVQSAASWTAGIGAIVGLLAAAGWVAAIWWAMPIGRTALGGVAAAGLALSALALSVGELVPMVLAVGPWLVIAAAGTAAGWIAWRLYRQGAADWGVARALSAALDAVEADPAPDAAHRQDAAKQALAEAVARAKRRPDFERLRGPRRAWAGGMP